MEPEKNKIGRPTLLTKELIEKALFYLAGDGWRAAGDAVPSVAGLACYLGISRPAIYDYKEQSDEFYYILEGIAAAQERMLINGGLLGDYNPTITKMMMTKHGYTDKHEVDNTSSDGSLSMPSFVIQPVSVSNENRCEDTSET